MAYILTQGDNFPIRSLICCCLPWGRGESHKKASHFHEPEKAFYYSAEQPVSRERDEMAQNAIGVLFVTALSQNAIDILFVTSTHGLEQLGENCRLCSIGIESAGRG
ncbi:hypothetical protein C5167_041352 [Papaver somniferum]|uniref:Uncharacterized protein n=1 Tax=Papaver somniferum TaxID=3469 RepID=A0A4Y7LJ68_PAPSO|nr:hypothetical protein C5167_047530 [Papaver somniferum]RZC84744.1 hypothetical protein C5167_047529 [Papaver somniferum]RZC85615.1 hypothetical protein C5167_041352 [Papaver somniferum]